MAALLLLVAANALDANTHAQFRSFMTAYNKSYSDAEYTHRLEVFADNLERAKTLNADNVRLGGEGNVFGVTKFSDLSPAEFKKQYLTVGPFPEDFNQTVREGHPGPLRTGVSIDWRSKGAVSHMKDQAQCGSCWAFSAVQAIESFAFLEGKGMHGLSPSQIVECDRNGPDKACNGGFPTGAFSYVQHAGGLMHEADYPYRNGNGNVGSCMFQASKAAVKVHGYKTAPKGESSLEHELSYGPPSVIVAADAWQSYAGGIMHSCPGQLDHAVQAVAVASDHFVLKNQWGAGWGEKGYIRVAKGGNICGLSEVISYPVIG